MSSSSFSSTASSKVIHPDNQDPEQLVTKTEKVNLTKNQYEVLNII
jgi:hypothetical protein